MDNTYIKLFRRILGWEWYEDTNTFRVFMHILLRANYEPSRYKGHEIGAGECVFGYRAWAEELGLSVQQVRTAIKHLISTHEITIESTHQFSIIHIEKWEFWQVEEGKLTRKTTRKPTNEQQTSNTQVTRSKESKKVRITTTPTIEEVREYVADNNLVIDADYFWKYYETAEWKDAKGKPVKNWKLKALNWNRRESNDDRRSNGERTEVRTGSGVRNATNTDSGKTVWKRFKTMEDVLQENQRCESDA